MNYRIRYLVRETDKETGNKKCLNKHRIYDARSYSDAAYRAYTEFEIWQRIEKAEDKVELELIEMRIMKLNENKN